MSRACVSIERASSVRVGFIERRARVASVLPAPAITASGVRRSCEIEASSVLRSLSLRRRYVLRPRLRQPRALEREADLAGKRLEQMPLLGQQHPPRVARQHRQHAQALRAPRPAEDTAPARRAACRTPGPRAGRDRQPTAPRRDPRRDTTRRAASRPDTELAVQHRAAARRLALEHFGDMLDGDARHAVDAARGGELAAHRVQQRRAPLARAGDARLLAHAAPSESR